MNKALVPYDRITVHKGEFKPVEKENLKNVVKYKLELSDNVSKKGFNHETQRETFSLKQTR